MRTSTRPRHPPTSPAWLRGLLLAVSCVLGRTVPMGGPTGGVLVPATIREQTVVFSDSDPPQPRGDCFSVSPTSLRWEWWIGLGDGLGGGRRPELWRIANMHAQNFAGIVERLGLRQVEVQPLGAGQCLITDSRIPRDWLRDRPCSICFRQAGVEDLLRRYPERFRPPADR